MELRHLEVILSAFARKPHAVVSEHEFPPLRVDVRGGDRERDL
jgi:hypothetical protein